MSPEAIQRGANAIRYYDAVVMPHHMALHRACLARGLDSEAAIRQSAIELVAELGDPLVQCIRDLWDARVRTPAGAVTRCAATG
jgi:hypothetical protein